MKQRFGAILCILLGAVLIGTGLNGTAAGSVGLTVPVCGAAQVGTAVLCPTGTISFTETTTGTGAVPPANWTVHITSTCLDPATGQPVDQTVTVPDGGTGASTPLELYTDSGHGTVCSYTYAEDPVPANFAAVFAPASPQGIPDSGGASNSGLKVALTNTYTAPTPTTSSATVTASASVSASVTASSSAVPTPAASSSAAGLANTGPHEQVGASVWIGAALCLLGLVLLLAGRTRRRSAHSR